MVTVQRNPSHPSPGCFFKLLLNTFLYCNETLWLFLKFIRKYLKEKFFSPHNPSLTWRHNIGHLVEKFQFEKCWCQQKYYIYLNKVYLFQFYLSLPFQWWAIRFNWTAGSKVIKILKFYQRWVVVTRSHL